MTPLLEARDVSAGYNGQPVIRNCSLTVAPGQAVALVGRNGAGKTTLVSAISGRVPLLAGDLTFSGRAIGHLPAFRRSRVGIVHVPQGREVFARLSVFENLRIAARPGATAAEWDFVYDLFPRLKARLAQKAGTLSGGEQQMVAIARAILTRAPLIILDEPSLGLAPKVVETLFASIRRMRESLDITLILVEQQARWIWEAGIVDYIYVLGDGMIVASGSPDALDEAAVQESYLGKMGAA
jgi:branched-chain amino acid transport system ATP-binding protein